MPLPDDFQPFHLQLHQWPQGHDSSGFIQEFEYFINHQSPEVLQALLDEKRLPAGAPRRQHARMDRYVEKSLKRQLKGAVTMADIRYELV